MASACNVSDLIAEYQGGTEARLRWQESIFIMQLRHTIHFPSLHIKSLKSEYDLSVKFTDFLSARKLISTDHGCYQEEDAVYESKRSIHLNVTN